MNAIDAKVGQKYLSKKGTPVTMIAHKGDKVTLKISGSDNEIDVVKNYELKPYRDAEVNKEAKFLIRANGGRGKGGRKPSKESLSTTIDPMLLAGGKTVKDIAELAIKNAPDLAKGKDVEANVRARMVSFSRKGWKIEKDDKKHIRVIKPKEVAHAN
ncbi:MAG: hypothetical protein KCHDKBKB_01650 [Elusimicrobia bacterium]|nr:hypothetical protein [Elusimicrobiota bacterium]